LQVHDACQPIAECKAQDGEQRREHRTQQQRLVGDFAGQRTVPFADRPRDQGHRRNRHAHEQLAEQPQRIRQQRHGRQVRPLEIFAGQPGIGEADQHVQHLLSQHRPRRA
jgi:hypothetical protein